MRERGRLRHLPALALLMAGLVVCSAAPALAAAPATAAAVGASDFYTPPATLPADNGALIRYESSAVAYLGVAAQRIMYKSTDVHGAPVAVTGTVMEPTAPWTGGGERPLVSYAVGTIGQGDQCAPSVLFNQGLEYEAAFVAPMLAAGATVVVTDYQGLGTPDRVHTYLNRVDEAHAVLDAARAAQRLGAQPHSPVDVSAHGPVGIYGYSQGGGAAAAAAELQPSYAPELALVGTVAGAPPADLAKVADRVEGNVLSGALGYTLNSLIQDYPEITDQVNSLLNQRGKDLLAATKVECLAETALRFGFQHSKELTVSGLPATSFLTVEPFASMIAAQRIGALTPTAPVYIFQGRNDDAVPFGQSLQLAKDWCAHGATVQFQEYDFPSIFPGYGIGHVLPAVFGLPAAQQWLYQRFVSAAGSSQPAPSSCGALPVA